MSGSANAVFEVAPDVYGLTVGRWLMAVNVYVVRSDEAWALIDAGWPGSTEAIARAVASLCGPGAHPSVILLTHIHPDHSGSARPLAQAWDAPVLVHSAELPLAAGEIVAPYANLLDRWMIGPVMRLLPARTRGRLAQSGALTDVVAEIDARTGVPGLREWEAIPTPGHTPGQVAYYRPSDGLLVSGDAVLTLDVNSPRWLLGGARRPGGPPRYTTWDWSKAVASIATLAALRPRVLAPGHGRPLTDAVAPALAALAARYRDHAGAHAGQPETDPGGRRVAAGDEG